MQSRKQEILKNSPKEVKFKSRLKIQESSPKMTFGLASYDTNPEKQKAIKKSGKVARSTDISLDSDSSVF